MAGSITVGGNKIFEHTGATGSGVVQMLDQNGSPILTDTGTSVTIDNVGFGNLTRFPLSRKNLIINGAMQVAQRGTLNTDASGYTTIDRFAINKTGSSMTFKDEQVSDAPPGFVYSKKVTVTAVNTTTTDHRCSVYQFLEGYVINPFGWGTANAENVTISFWVKGSETGTYTVMFQSQNDSGRMYAAPYTINLANTWEYKIITVPGDTGGDCWGNKTNNEGLQIRFSLGTASSRQITASTWTTGTGDFGATGEKDITTILNATWQITGVQLEVGSVATPFEQRSYGEELALCKRYYERLYSYGNTGTRTRAWVTHTVEKRATPTVTLVSGTNSGVGGTILTIGFSNYFASTTENEAFSADFTSDAEL